MSLQFWFDMVICGCIGLGWYEIRRSLWHLDTRITKMENVEK